MDDRMQKKLNSSMPWVGMYIAASSATCTLAILADAARAFRIRKFWIPCKFFRLNAFWITLLTVAMKLPLDYTTVLDRVDDKLARLSSLVLLSTAMGNFPTSLGTMEDNEIMLSICALGLLVVSVAGNQFLRLFELYPLWGKLYIVAEEMTATLLMFPLFISLCSLAVMVPAAKRSIDSKYEKMHNIMTLEKFTTNEQLEMVVKRYWVMAETGSPQYVIARSVTSIPIGAMCLLMALIQFEAGIRLPLVKNVKGNHSNHGPPSNYGWSTKWILSIQCIGVTAGTITAMLRLFMATRFKCKVELFKSWRDEFKVESYWTQMLLEWRESPLPLLIRHQKIRKVIHDAKRLVLNFFIGVQILNVLFSKVVLFVLAALLSISVACLHRIKNFQSQESVTETELDLMRECVLQLAGEAELPLKALKNLCDDMDRLTEISRMKSKNNLIKLLKKSKSFEGVKEFDSTKILRLRFQGPEPPNCWSLPVATLAAIALALSDRNCKPDQLLSGVGEAMAILKIIEKALDEDGALRGIRNAAEVVWVRIELYGKWLHKDIRPNMNQSSLSYQQKLQELSDAAKTVVMSFINDSNDFIPESPTNYPVNVIAANSMYRITQTLLQDSKIGNCNTEEERFDRLSIMIADILAACLTNLKRSLILMCHSTAIKERVGNVRRAAVLLGETEEVPEILRQHALPRLQPYELAKIDSWREFGVENP